MAIGLGTKTIAQAIEVSSTAGADRRWYVAVFGMWMAGLWIIVGGPLAWAFMMATAS